MSMYMISHWSKILQTGIESNSIKKVFPDGQLNNLICRLIFWNQIEIYMPGEIMNSFEGLGT